MTYSIIIPIYNEQNTLPSLLKKLNKLDKKLEIIIIDDGSSDETADILHNQKTIKVLRSEINQGKGKSIRNGIKIACNKNIILIDGDLEIDIDQIPNLINTYEHKGFEVLSGKRWNKSEKFEFDIYRIGNFFINGLFNILFNTNFNDILCCVKIIDKELINSLYLISNGFDIEIEIMSKLTTKRVKTYEVPVSYLRRSSKQGKKLNILDGWKIIKLIFLQKIKTLF